MVDDDDAEDDDVKCTRQILTDTEGHAERKCFKNVKAAALAANAPRNGGCRK